MPLPGPKAGVGTLKHREGKRVAQSPPGPDLKLGLFDSRAYLLAAATASSGRDGDTVPPWGESALGAHLSPTTEQGCWQGVGGAPGLRLRASAQD